MLCKKTYKNQITLPKRLVNNPAPRAQGVRTTRALVDKEA